MLNGLCKLLAEIITPVVNVEWRWKLKNIILRRLGLSLGEKVAIDKGFDWLIKSGQVVLEDYAVIGKNLRIYNFSDVQIGRFCMFAGDIIIANGGHDTSSFQPFSGPLKIGHGCWIGVGAKIVGANLDIGNNVIVSAGALVISDVPANAIVAGVPAKVVGYRALPDKVWHLGDTWFCPRTFKVVMTE